MQSGGAYFAVLSACLLLCLLFAIYTFTEISDSELLDGSRPFVTAALSAAIDTQQRMVSDAVEEQTVHCGSMDGKQLSGVVSDDYCDCTANGVDEVMTAACSYYTAGMASFDCGNGSVVIFASRVNDGVVDCPNESDERRPPLPATLRPTERSSERIEIRRYFRHSSRIV